MQSLYMYLYSVEGRAVSCKKILYATVLCTVVYVVRGTLSKTSVQYSMIDWEGRRQKTHGASRVETRDTSHMLVTVKRDIGTRT